MDTHFIDLDMDECSTLANDIFMQTSGVNKEGRKFERMRNDAFRMRRVIEERIQIRAAYKYFDKVELSGQNAVFGGRTFRCSAFDQIDGNTVKGVYVYALSVGDFGFPEEPILDQLYADIWGSAFTDAVRLLMKKQIAKESMLSDSFDPGFYGMDVSEMGSLTSLLNLDELDIEIRNSRIMLPLKSCAGFYFSVDERYRKLDQACENCLGTHRSCKLCQVYGGIN